jgi:hypothetical protein
MSSGFAGGGLRFTLASTHATILPTAGVGLAALWFTASGAPSPNFVGHTDRIVTPAPTAALGIGASIAKHVRVRADLIGAVAIQRPVVLFANRDVASWGRPLLAPSLGFELAWP